MGVLQLIDDLSVLESQINMRCQVGLTDLNKYCEDFFKEIINITYDLNLKNLNDSRSNEPGLDLGDAKNKIAYQITSVSTSQKVNHTLEKITKEQLKTYDQIKVLILGKKQNSYDALKEDLMTKCNFNIADILDISDICKQIVSVKYDHLFELHKMFEKQFQIVLTEIEIPNKEGIYPTTLYDKLEIAPSTFCLNAEKFLKDYPGHPLENIREFFDDLGQLPRVTREFLEIVISIGEQIDGNYRVNYNELKRKLSIPLTELQEEISILSNRRMVFEPDDYEPEIKTRFVEIGIDITEFALNNNCTKKLIVAMDFTIMDE